MKTLLVRTLAEWRGWLAKNHASVPEVWLIFHRQHTRVDSIDYKDALDEALCFGWVDSLVKRLDDRRFARKFTPRRQPVVGREPEAVRPARSRRTIEAAGDRAHTDPPRFCLPATAARAPFDASGVHPDGAEETPARPAPLRIARARATPEVLRVD